MQQPTSPSLVSNLMCKDDCKCARDQIVSCTIKLDSAKGHTYTPMLMYNVRDKLGAIQGHPLIGRWNNRIWLLSEGNGPHTSQTKMLVSIIVPEGQMAKTKQ